MFKRNFRIFLSYASEQKEIAEEIESRLSVQGYEVFFDKKSLPVGEEYDRKIREAIETSDLMIFLISPESIQDGSYARTELEYASKTWKNPDRRVFPVLVKDTPFSEIPKYLTSVTILSAEGNIAAEVLNVIDKFVATNKDKTIIEVIRELNEEIRKAKIEKHLIKLDAEWEETRAEHTVKLNGQDTGFVPTTYLAATVPLIIGLSFSIFGYFEYENFAFGGLLVVFPLFLGFGAAVYFCMKIREFKEAERNYELEREKIRNGEISNRYKILYL